MAAVRQLIQDTLAAQHYEVVGVAASGMEALKQCRQFEPDLLIAEMDLPDLSGLALLGSLKEVRSRTRVLIYTACRNEGALCQLLRLRPDGLVSKCETLSVLWAAIAALARGSRYISGFYRDLDDRVASGATALDLEPRELIMLQMIADSQPTKVIADRIGLSPKGAEHVRQRLMAKFGAHDPVQLTRLALLHGYVN